MAIMNGTHVHTCIHTHACNMYTVYEYLSVCLSIYVYVCMHIHLHAHTWIYIYIYIYMDGYTPHVCCKLPCCNCLGSRVARASSFDEKLAPPSQQELRCRAEF